MRFDLTQHFSAPATDVAAAFADPAFYANLERLPRLGRPEVLHHAVRGKRAHLEVRYRFAGELSPPARAILDPAKLTWVEVTEHDLTRHVTTFLIRPDHYADRLTCSGSYRFHPDPERRGSALRLCDGDVRVRTPLVGPQVERAIISGIREHLEWERPLLEQWLHERADTSRSSAGRPEPG